MHKQEDHSLEGDLQTGRLEAGYWNVGNSGSRGDSEAGDNNDEEEDEGEFGDNYGGGRDRDGEEEGEYADEYGETRFEDKYEDGKGGFGDGVGEDENEGQRKFLQARY